MQRVNDKLHLNLLSIITFTIKMNEKAKLLITPRSAQYKSKIVIILEDV
jgi:hypothetical protein